MKIENPTKRAFIRVRLQAQERRIIERQAAAAGVSLSEYIRQALHTITAIEAAGARLQVQGGACER